MSDPTTDALHKAREALKAAQAALAAAEEAAGVRQSGDEGTDDRTRMALDALTVKRIDVVEDDGTLRMVIGNSTHARTIPLRRTSRTHPGRARTAGLLFVNDDGTECGGLQYSGRRDDGDAPSQVGLIAFDDVEQNEGVRLGLAQRGGTVERFIEFIDRPAWSLVDLMDDLDAATDQESRDSARRRYYTDARELGTSRVLIARDTDGNARIVLRDGRGRDRLRFVVPEDGTPVAEIVDEVGAARSLLAPGECSHRQTP